MKKLLGFLSIVIGMCSVAFANQPDVGSNMVKQEPTSFFTESECEDGSPYYHTWHYYVGDNFRLIDTHQGDNNYYHIYDDSTIVYVKDPYNVFNFSNGNDFQFKSNGKWRDVNAVIFVEKFGSFKTGTLPAGGYNGAFAGQIAFHLARATYTAGGSTRRYISYFLYPSGPQKTRDKKLKNTDDSQGEIHGGLECFNYAVHYCGDGVTDTHDSIAAFGNYGSNVHGYTGSIANEICDDGADNGQPGRCNTSCDGYVPTESDCGNGTLEAGEECDPGNGNFGNGCDSNCHLMIPSCTLTVTPNQGNIPLNTTIDATKPNWAIYTNLVFGDGQSQSNPAFALNHTYNTVGTFNLTLTVKNNYNGQINATHIPTATCTGSVNTTNSEQQPQCNSQYSGQTQYTPDSDPWLNQNMNLCNIGSVNNFQSSWEPGHSRHFTWNCNVGGNLTDCTAYQVWCGDGKVSNREKCDPNDPYRSGWNNNGYTCNEQCELVQDPGQQPQCNSTYNGTHYVNNPAYPDWLTESMDLCSKGTVVPNSLTHRWSGYGDVGHYGWSCTNSVGTTGCQANQQRCGDGIKNGSEACDPNDPDKNNWGVGGCNNNCTQNNSGLDIEKELLTDGDFAPGDTVAYKVTLTNLGNVVYHNAVIDDTRPKALTYVSSSISLATGYKFTSGFDNGYLHLKYYDFDVNPNSSVVVYFTGVLKELYDWEETTNCVTTFGDVDCEIFVPKPVPYLQKWQSLYEHGLFTTGILQVHFGDNIYYKVEFGNLGRTGAYGEVRDILPNCVQFVSSSLNLEGIGPQTGHLLDGSFYVKYSNIYLAPGQTGYMMVVGKIKSEDGCQTVTGYLNTGQFHFINTSWQNSTVLAERDDTINVEIKKEVSPAGPVQPGDVVTYTINYENKGPEELQSYTIVDYWPSELTFSGVVYMNPVASNYPGFRESNNGNKIVRWTFDTPLPVNGTGQIVIQGIVNDY